MSDERTERAYLGDGVYASFDGYQIWLAANDHRNDVVALEPSVMAALSLYARRVFNDPRAVLPTGDSHVAKGSD